MLRFADSITQTLPDVHWRMLKQIGVDDAVIAMPKGFSAWRDTDSDRPWDYAPMAMYRDMLDAEGLTVSVVEDWPQMDDIRYGRPGREEALQNVIDLIRTMGALGIPVWSYSWSAGLSWLRTSMTMRGRGGAHVTGYDQRALGPAGPPRAGAIGSDELWSNLCWFLDRIIPVAEDVGVRMSLHPDDPPVREVRGVARVMRTVDDFERLLDYSDSEVNGVTFCQGTLALSTPDIPAAIRRLGADGRIHFVHFRDVNGTAENFVETFHDNGMTDMYAAMEAYRDIGFEGVMRPDHVPTLEGDKAPIVPGYAIMGRLHAIGYMTGIREAVYRDTGLTAQ